MFALVRSVLGFMAAPALEENLHEDYVALCTRHGFDARFRLSNQIEGSFIGRHKDFENIQGTVSLFYT